MTGGELGWPLGRDLYEDRLVQINNAEHLIREWSGFRRGVMDQVGSWGRGSSQHFPPYCDQLASGWNVVTLTLLETSLTLPEARATAVSAMTSALMEPRPPVALVLMKLSNTTSSRSVI